MSRKLVVDDIADLRAYEKVRDRSRTDVIELKRRRRVSLGTVITILFENRVTVRNQVQEMARAEQITTDAGIQEELDVYNPLIPEPGQLCATLFIELTSEEAMHEWLPKLVGIERSVVIRLANGDRVRGEVEAQHASRLTRDHVTAAVHYLTFELTPDQVEVFVEGTQLSIDHPDYIESVVLAPFTVDELRTDLLG